MSSLYRNSTAMASNIDVNILTCFPLKCVNKRQSSAISDANMMSVSKAITCNQQQRNFPALHFKHKNTLCITNCIMNVYKKIGTY